MPCRPCGKRWVSPLISCPARWLLRWWACASLDLARPSRFARKTCEQAGGFAALEDYLADDYQLARRITLLGKRALLSTYVVETSLGDTTWRGVWDHQLRWGRTIRMSKGGGYAGLPITHAGALDLDRTAAAVVVGRRRARRTSLPGGLAHRLVRLAQSHRLGLVPIERAVGRLRVCNLGGQLPVEPGPLEKPSPACRCRMVELNRPAQRE